MNNPAKNDARVVAIDPTIKGFAYTVFEGEELIDWGQAFVGKEKKNAKCLQRLKKLLERYEPDVIVLEDPEAPGCRRRLRVRALIASIRVLARRHRVRVRTISRRQVLEAFSLAGATTKDEIAAEVARRYPELAPRLPVPRKIWMPEDPQINLFDAAAFAITLFEIGKRRRGSRRKQVETLVFDDREAAITRFLCRSGRQAAARRAI